MSRFALSDDARGRLVLLLREGETSSAALAQRFGVGVRWVGRLRRELGLVKPEHQAMTREARRAAARARAGR